MPDETRLSASKIKTLESCAYKYWCTYHLKLPRSSNDGASRGTACHLVLEVLLNPRHRHKIDILLKSNTIESVPSIPRLITKTLLKLGYYSEENLLMCDDMILVALNCDFLGERGGEITEPEKEFYLESEDPEYKILGYMDKPIQYKKNKKVVIVDYKTSKQKFSKSEQEFNIQALAYILAAKKVWPDIKEASIEFQFLKFPKEPIMTIKATEAEIKGFEKWLAHIYKMVKNFKEPSLNEDSNFAKFHPRPSKDEGFKGPLNCGFAQYPGHLKKDGNPMWHCEHKFAYDYFGLMDENGAKIKSAMSAEELDSSKGEVVKLRYDGCPAWPQRKEDDDFGF